MHFYKELSAGQFPVRWAFDLNFRYGSPVFSFFYPLMYYLASLFHFLGLDFGASLKAVIISATFGSTFLMYLWLSRRFSIFASLVGSLLYVYIPYRLLTMYVTGSFGVLLSLVFVPLAFLAIDGLAERKNIALLSLAISGLLTSHNVTALILLPIVAAYWLTGRKYFLRGIAGFVLGLGLASFFIWPALLETKYVFLSQGVVVNFQDHFPTLKQLIYSPWGYFYSVAGDADGMSFQVGVAAWAVLVLGLLTILFKVKKVLDEKTRIASLFCVVFLIAIVMMLSISKPIWEMFPLLAQIQFPWRILAAITVAIPFLAAFVVENKFGKAAAILLLILLVWNNRNYLRTWEATRYPDESYQKRESLYYGSTDIAWETRPIWAEGRPVWLAKEYVFGQEGITVIKQERSGTQIKVRLNSAKPTPVTVNQFYYPTWKASIDERPAEIRPTEKTGLVSVEISEGEHTLKLAQGKTDISKVADTVSITSFVIFVFLLTRQGKPHTSRRS